MVIGLSQCIQTAPRDFHRAAAREARMSGMDFDDTELDRQLGRLESRYRAASLRLDLARLEYFRLRRDAGDPAQIASAEEKVLQLARQREALRDELERLEDLH
jgi:hypothetical protein